MAPPKNDRFRALLCAFLRADFLRLKRIRLCNWPDDLLVLGRLVDGFTANRPPAPTERISTQAAKVRDRLLNEIAAPSSVAELAAFVSLTPVQLVRAFTRAYGLLPHQWLNVQRLTQARRTLQTGLVNLATLALDLGFADQAHFTRRFAAMHGVTPAAYVRG